MALKGYMPARSLYNIPLRKRLKMTTSGKVKTVLQCAQEHMVLTGQFIVAMHHCVPRSIGKAEMTSRKENHPRLS